MATAVSLDLRTHEGKTYLGTPEWPEVFTAPTEFLLGFDHHLAKWDGDKFSLWIENGSATYVVGPDFAPDAPTVTLHRAYAKVTGPPPSGFVVGPLPAAPVPEGLALCVVRTPIEVATPVPVSVTELSEALKRGEAFQRSLISGASSAHQPPAGVPPVYGDRPHVSGMIPSVFTPGTPNYDALVYAWLTTRNPALGRTPILGERTERGPIADTDALVLAEVEQLTNDIGKKDYPSTWGSVSLSGYALATVRRTAWQRWAEGHCLNCDDDASPPLTREDIIRATEDAEQFSLLYPGIPSLGGNGPMGFPDPPG